MKRLLKYGASIILLSMMGAIGVNAQTTRGSSTLPGGTGNMLNYPLGTRIYPSGTIISPRGEPLFPNNTVRRADGSATFYYPNGTRVTTKGDAINSSGTNLSPGINGGLRNNSLNNRNYLNPTRRGINNRSFGNPQ